MNIMTLYYHLVARAFGYRIASVNFLQDRSAASILFCRTLSRPRHIFFVPSFKDKNPKTCALMEHLRELSAGKWVIVSEPPARKDNSFFSLGGISPSVCEEGHTSLIDFINSLTVVNVQRSTDGIQRRGIVAKK
jgi:hypothetical protein